MNSTVKFLANEEKKADCGADRGAGSDDMQCATDDGKKVVFLAFHGKAMRREVQVISQRSGGLLVQGLKRRRRRYYRRRRRI